MSRKRNREKMGGEKWGHRLYFLFFPMAAKGLAGKILIFLDLGPEELAPLN